MVIMSFFDLWQLDHWRSRLQSEHAFHIILSNWLVYYILIQKIYNLFYIRFWQSHLLFDIFSFGFSTNSTEVEKVDEIKNLFSWTDLHCFYHLIIWTSQVWLSKRFEPKILCVILSIFRIGMGFWIMLLKSWKLQLSYDLFIIIYSLLGFGIFFIPPLVWYSLGILLYLPTLLCIDLFFNSTSSRLECFVAGILLVFHFFTLLQLIFLLQHDIKREKFLLFIPGFLIYVVAYLLLIPSLFATYRYEARCYVCQENFDMEPSRQLIILNCGHDLHSDCFDSHQEFILCGICRQNSEKVSLFQSFRF